jgi:pimeloyl-[acyl-carrier protein] synthase
MQSMRPHPRTPEFSADAYQARLYENYRDFLENSPVFVSDEGVVYLSRYKDCVSLLGSPGFFRMPPRGSGPFPGSEHSPTLLETMIGHWMVFMDPPRHDLVRKAFMAAFTARAVTDLEPLIREQVRQLLQSWPPDGNIEFVREFAFLLPVRVIALMLGVPLQDVPRFHEWAAVLTEALDTGTESALRQGEGAAASLKDYFSTLIRQRKELSPDCLINTVAERNGKLLSEEEFLFGCAFLLWAGHETTKNLLANGLFLLAQHPAQLSRLQQEPGLLASAVEEMLRFESPVQKISRWTHQDAQFGEYVVPANTLVTALIGAAHRDSRAFDNPDRFDITRTKNRHIAFGTGVHHCLGALLARTEARIGFGELLPRLRRLELIDYQWRNFSAFRSLDALNLGVQLEC